MANTSNYTPLSPQSFLRRNSRVYPDKTAVIHGKHRVSYLQFFERACRQANALAALGLTRGDKIAVLAPNIPAHLEANFGIHMMGGVLVAINYRLNSKEVAFILEHSESKALIVDSEFLPIIEPAYSELTGVEHIIVVEDSGKSIDWKPEGTLDYETLLAEAAADYPGVFPEDENETISINYTSGTTGNPKGVIYTHRSTYLNAVCGVLQSTLSADAVYLWTLPMFHCNGWCYTWGVTAMGGTHVCLREVESQQIIRSIQQNKVTHFNGAPIVLKMVADGARMLGVERFPMAVKATTAAAPPSPALIKSMLDLNISVVHVYGLTETYGPTTVCEIQPKWRDLPIDELTRLMARQGVPFVLSEDLQVLNEQGEPVPEDGITMGEVCMRGNIVAKGYYKNATATAKAMRGGWFHSGDLGVMHPDGYIELKDRAKDIIISGGENISTIEVENILHGHPTVDDVAVVSKPDDTWGEVPVAFINLRAGVDPNAEELRDYCRSNMAHFKVPKDFIFEPLPRTSTGKVQKFVLRDRLWAGNETRIRG